MAAAALLTIPEVAERLRLHRDSVYKRIAAGLIVASNLAEPGGRPHLRVSERDLADYIDSCRIPAPKSTRSRRRRPT